MPFHFVQVSLGIFHRLFLVLVPFVFHSLYSKGIALRSLSFCRCGVEHEKLLTLSSAERHDHGASSLPAAINRPPDILPAGRRLRRVQALFNNTIGNSNTAEGFRALFNNTTGIQNATGFNTLFHNTTGEANTAHGREALFNNTIGSLNTANGVNALFRNTTGTFNTATGNEALFFNTIGNDNTANGVSALANNTTSKTRPMVVSRSLVTASATTTRPLGFAR
jgi:hypothetical protein